MGETFLDIIDDYSDRLAFPLLTPEYRIACVLVDDDSATPSALQKRSGLSPTGFFNTLETMKSKGILIGTKDPTDRRKTIYTLHPDIHSRLVNQFRYYNSSEIDAFSSLGMPRSELGGEGNLVSQSIFISHLTCGYQILLYLHIRPGILNSQFVDIVNASPTKFNAVLKDLTDKGQIYFKHDPKDRRRKRYFLSEQVREQLDELHRRVYQWLKRRHGLGKSGGN